MNSTECLGCEKKWSTTTKSGGFVFNKRDRSIGGEMCTECVDLLVREGANVRPLGVGSKASS